MFTKVAASLSLSAAGVIGDSQVDVQADGGIQLMQTSATSAAMQTEQEQGESIELEIQDADVISLMQTKSAIKTAQTESSQEKADALLSKEEIDTAYSGCIGSYCAPRLPDTGCIVEAVGHNGVATAGGPYCQCWEGGKQLPSVSIAPGTSVSCDPGYPYDYKRFCTTTACCTTSTCLFISQNCPDATDSPFPANDPRTKTQANNGTFNPKCRRTVNGNWMDQSYVGYDTVAKVMVDKCCTGYSGDGRWKR